MIRRDAARSLGLQANYTRCLASEQHLDEKTSQK